MTNGLFQGKTHRYQSGQSTNTTSQTSNFSSSMGCLGRQIEAGRSTLQSLRKNNETPGNTESPADFRRNSRTSNGIIEDPTSQSYQAPNQSIVLKSGVTENSSLNGNATPEYDIPRGIGNSHHNNPNFSSSVTTFNQPPSSPATSSYTNNKPTPPPPNYNSKSSPFLVQATVPNMIGNQSHDQLLHRTNKQQSESSTPSLVDEMTNEFDKYSNHTLPNNNYRTGYAKPKRGQNMRKSHPQKPGQYSLPKLPTSSSNTNNNSNKNKNTSNLNNTALASAATANSLTTTRSMPAKPRSSPQKPSLSQQHSYNV